MARPHDRERRGAREARTESNCVVLMRCSGSMTVHLRMKSLNSSDMPSGSLKSGQPWLLWKETASVVGRGQTPRDCGGGV